MDPTINLTHLKFFCDAIVYESLSEAAKMNYISQSAISQAISKLESIFGVDLIFHNRQKLQMTPEGQIVFEQAKDVFKSVQNTFQKIHQSKKEVSGTLKFVTTNSLGMSFIAPMYKQFKQNIPHIDFKFRMGGLNLIRTALKREDVEFAIVVYDHNFDQFEKHSLKEGHLKLYQSSISDPKLIREGIFIDEEEGLYIKELKSHLNKKGYQKSVQDAVAGWEVAARFVELGMGVGFFPDYIISNDRYPNIIPHPLKTPSFKYEICAIYNKGIKLSRTAQLFLKQFSWE